MNSSCVRVERAKRELAQSQRSIAEIARDVGFGSRIRMYEAFRCEVGSLPEPIVNKENLGI